MSSRSYFASAVIPFRLVFLMWLVFTLQFYLDIDLSMFMLVPRKLEGLLGILGAPMLHGSLTHLISNTVPLLFLGGTLFFFYNSIGASVFFRCYFLPNVLVWLFSPRQMPHIGASGLIYALSAFLIFFGFLRKDVLSILISIVVILLYGGIFYGILPTDPWISWESHLAGTIVGLVTAFTMRKIKKV